MVFYTFCNNHRQNIIFVLKICLEDSKKVGIDEYYSQSDGSLNCFKVLTNTIFLTVSYSTEWWQTS